MLERITESIPVTIQATGLMEIAATRIDHQDTLLQCVLHGTKPMEPMLTGPILTAVNRTDQDGTRTVVTLLHPINHGTPPMVLLLQTDPDGTKTALTPQFITHGTKPIAPQL